MKLFYALVFLLISSLSYAQSKSVLTSVVGFLPKIKKIDYALGKENNIFKYEVTVVNTVNKPVSVTVIAEKPIHVENKNESLVPYLINKNLSFTMGPNEKIKYVFEFRLPKDIQGTKYLGYSFDGIVVGKQTGFMLKQQNRGLLLLNFAGTEKRDAKIKVSETYKKKSNEIFFDLNIDNVGNTFLRKIKNTGILFKLNKDKKEFIGKIFLESRKKQYLPQGNKRKYAGKIKSKKLKKGKYQFLVNTVDFNGYTKMTTHEFEI